MLNEIQKYDQKITIRICLFVPKSYQSLGATDPINDYNKRKDQKDKLREDI